MSKVGISKKEVIRKENYIEVNSISDADIVGTFNILPKEVQERIIKKMNQNSFKNNFQKRSLFKKIIKEQLIIEREIARQKMQESRKIINKWDKILEKSRISYINYCMKNNLPIQ